MEEGEVKEETGSCLCHLKVYINKDFHHGPVVKNLPWNAEDASWIPGQQTKIPHVRGQLNWHAAAREAHVLQQRPSTTKRKRNKKRKWTYVYPWLMHIDVWQKATQYCKAIILQLKIDKVLKRKKEHILRFQETKKEHILKFQVTNKNSAQIKEKEKKKRTYSKISGK